MNCCLVKMELYPSGLCDLLLHNFVIEVNKFETYSQKLIYISDMKSL
jgi:hypothetical protein